jgi:hypothetical protein
MIPFFQWRLEKLSPSSGGLKSLVLIFNEGTFFN